MRRKIILTLLCIADALTLYLSVGYALRGACGARLVGENTAHFIGYYMLAAPFVVAFLVCAVFTVMLAVKLIKNNNSGKK